MYQLLMVYGLCTLRTAMYCISTTRHAVATVFYAVRFSVATNWGWLLFEGDVHFVG